RLMVTTLSQLLGRSKQRQAQNSLADEFAQHVTGGCHYSTGVCIPEQSLDARMLGKRRAAADAHRRRGDGDRGVAACSLTREHPQHRGVTRPLQVINEVIDACRQPVGLDLHRGELRSQGWQALPEALPEVLKTGSLEMRGSRGHGSAAQA